MEKKNLLFSSLFFSVTFCFFAPLELYLTNRQDFWFDIQSVIAIPIITMLVVWGLLFFPGLVLGEKGKCIWTALVFSVSCLTYLQGNFMNKQVGIMNGMMIDWEEHRISFLINWVIWVLFVIVLLIWYTRDGKYTKKIVSYISLCMVLIQVFTLSVLFIMARTDKSGSADRYISMKGIYEVSTDENVIVFLLDMFDDRYFDELIEEEPETAYIFDGFTQYTNFVGGYGTTTYSIPHLLTGGYILNQRETFDEEINYLYEDTIVWDELAEQGYDINLYTYEFCMPHELRQILSNYDDGRSEIVSYFELSKNIYELAACKYLPDFCKQHCWLIGNEFDELRLVNGEYSQMSYSNVEFYNNLKDAGLSTKENKDFKFIHLDGTHYPYTINENVEELGNGNVSREQTVKGCIKIVQEYLDEMKACGVYDNSSIIITADHGYYQKGLITNPVLLVKPKSSHGELQFSNACISQKDFHSTILSLTGLNEDLQYGYGYTDVEEGMERERFYYQYADVKNSVNTQDRRYVEYRVDPDSNERSSFHITGYEYDLLGQRVDHLALCSVCQSGNGEADNHDTVIIHE